MPIACEFPRHGWGQVLRSVCRLWVTARRPRSRAVVVVVVAHADIEAALTAGFTAIGVDSATAMAAAITYRLVTFYLPPCLGYFTLRSLRAQHLL